MQKRVQHIFTPKQIVASSFGINIFIGAFLLFQIQPIIGKYILPWFGGTSAVWATALLFFQLLLLCGYGYVFLLSRISLKKQVLVHSILLLCILSLIIFLFFTWQSPIQPDIGWKLSDAYSPILQVLSLLFLSVGFPYFILSTTSILLQKWYSAIQSEKSPYMFYALSNAASLFGIVSYPVLIEPFLRLHTQGVWWSVAFIVYTLILLLCCALTFFFHNRSQKNTMAIPPRKQFIEKRTYALWLLLPALSSVMLLSITNLLTQSVAPIPFLWMLPLSLYLLSFILCFSGTKWYWRNFSAYIFILFTPLSLVFGALNMPNVFLGLLVYSLVLLSACMLCHGEVYHNRPDPKYLDIFYVCISLGSVLGAVFVSIIAPLFFKGLWEVYIGFYCSFLLAIIVLFYYRDSFVYRHMRLFFTSAKEVYLCAALLFPFTIAIITGTLFIYELATGNISRKAWRNFYGLVEVKTVKIKQQTVSSFNHGHIIHGMQVVSGPQRFEPNTYYQRKSGIGLALDNYLRPEKGLRVGLLGLGVGTLAAYGKTGDTYRFYEINPQVVDIARNHFTYLKDSKAHIEIIEGDGRLSLQEEVDRNAPEKYDVLVMDAFSDDAIPVHLLTKEAFDIYLRRIAYPNGLIAVHISNNYLDLKPVLVQIAKEHDLHYAFIFSPSGENNSPSEWALLTYNKQFLQLPAIAHATPSAKKIDKQVSLWTDDYSNLLKIIK